MLTHLVLTHLVRTHLVLTHLVLTHLDWLIRQVLLDANSTTSTAVRNTAAAGTFDYADSLTTTGSASVATSISQSGTGLLSAVLYGRAFAEDTVPYSC